MVYTVFSHLSHCPVGSDSGLTHYCTHSGSFYVAIKRYGQAFVTGDIYMGSNILRERRETQLLLKGSWGRKLGSKMGPFVTWGYFLSN